MEPAELKAQNKTPESHEKSSCGGCGLLVLSRVAVELANGLGDTLILVVLRGPESTHKPVRDVPGEVLRIACVLAGGSRRHRRV